MRLLALLPTLLLLRFLSESALCLPVGLPLPLRFSPLAAWLVGFVAVLGVLLVVPLDVAVVSALGSGEGDFLSVLGESSVELVLESGLFEPPPNILFNSRPPCEERLRRLLPARFSGRGKTRGLVVRGLRSESYVRDSCWKLWGDL